MRILAVYPGDRLTGASRYAGGLCHGLLARGHEVLVALHGEGPARDAFLADEEHRPQLTRIDLPPLRRTPAAAAAHLGGLITGTRRLSRFIDESRPDVVLAHCVFNVWGALAAKRRGIPLVAVIYEPRSVFPAPLYRAWAWLLSRTATRIIACSELMREELGLSSPGVEVVPLGVDTSVFHSGVDGEAVRAELAPDGAGPLIVCVSHLMEGKGQLDLVEALPQIIVAHPESRVVFVGSTNGRPRNEVYVRQMKERIQALGLEERVALVGERLAIAPILAAADVVVYPSHDESFGLVPLEAQAVGTRVVTSDVGAARSWAQGRAGVEVVPAKSPAALAEGVVRCLEAPRSAQPLKRVWTLEASVDSIESVLIEVACAPSDRRFERAPGRQRGEPRCSSWSS